MVSQLQPNNPTDIIYPDSDGQPMADNTKQWELIVYIKTNLDVLFADDPNVFVAGDLLWYPVEGENKNRKAPDTMVIFGRPKGYRGSYLQWKEDNIPPQVVFEILSPGNNQQEMLAKKQFYQLYGVEEYYLYDPDTANLSGWLRSENKLAEIPKMDGWVSPRLLIRFQVEDDELKIYYPDGKPFSTLNEKEIQLQEAEKRTEQERQRAEQERQQRLSAEAELQALRALLQSKEINPEQQ